MFHVSFRLLLVILVSLTVDRLRPHRTIDALAMATSVTGSESSARDGLRRDDEPQKADSNGDGQLSPSGARDDANAPPAVVGLSDQSAQRHLVLTVLEPVKVRRCEPIRIDLCAGLGYNVTGFPNLVGHDSATDAEQQLRTFGPLIQYDCSTNGELRLLLCAAYVPMCTEQFPEVIGPCRSVCERVRRRCEPLLHNFGFPWPDTLCCDRFHARNNEDDHMCMEGPEGGSSSGGGGDDDLASPFPSLDDPRQKTMIDDRRDVMSNCGRDGGAGDQQPSDSSSASELIRVWTTVWSVLAALSTLFVIVTFAIDAARYSYADRIVLLTATCSAVCAIAHLSRQAFAGDGIASPSSLNAAAIQQHPCPNGDVEDERRLVPAVTPSSRAEPGSECTIVFVVVYYFSTAASLWWLMLVVVLTLQAGGGRASGGGTAVRQRWTDAEIRRRLSTWLHLVVWSTPAVMTIVLLVRKEITVDTVTSDVGARPVCRLPPESGSSFGLILIPLSVCTALGIVLLVVAVIRFRFCRLDRGASSKCAHHDNESGMNKDTELLKQQQQPIGGVQQSLTTRSPMTTGSSGRAAPLASSSAKGSNNSSYFEEANGTVRIGVIGVVGAVALIAAISSLAREYAQHSSSSSVAAALIRILSSVLIAFVAGPWLVMSGQAAASWNGFVVRRRDRKHQHHHHRHQQQQQQRQQSPSFLPPSDRRQRLHCAARCEGYSDTESSANLSNHATTATEAVARRMSSMDSDDAGDRYQLSRQFSDCAVVDRPSSSSAAAANHRAASTTAHCNSNQRSSKTGGGISQTTVAAVASAVCQDCGIDLHRFREQQRLHRVCQCSPSPLGLPPPPPPSQCRSSAASGGLRSAEASAVGGHEPISCQYCRRQHHVNQYVI